MTTGFERVNPADTLLRVLLKLQDQPNDVSTVLALSAAMPLGEKEDRAASNMFAPRRVSILVDTIRELIALVSTARVRRDAAYKSLQVLLEVFSSIGTNAGADWGSKSGGLNAAVVNSIETLAYALPKDRADIGATDRSECAAALAALRQLLASLPDSESPAATELAKIIAMLEAAMLASHMQGQSAISDIMMRWARHHSRLNELLAAAPEDVQHGFFETYRPAVKVFMSIADNALRVDGLLSLAEKFKNALGFDGV
jgi:hypothetical protein